MDSRATIVLEQILPSIRAHVDRQGGKSTLPFVLGVTGLQGSGKSHLASALADELNKSYNYNTIEVSLDDFYLTHDDRNHLRQQYPSNKLLKVRGQPGTHDVELAKSFFGQFSNQTNDEIWIPSFDKSQFSGDGDRLPREKWRKIGTERPVDVLIFEGWCVGFQPLPVKDVETRRLEAVKLRDSRSARSEGTPDTSIESQFSTTTLAGHRFEDLLFVNEKLEQYCDGFLGPKHFNVLVHLDTDDLVNVYNWRIEQERALIKTKGSGMTDEQVVKFVQGYMPAYELYLDNLRAGFFRELTSSIGGKIQLHLLMDVHRNVLKHSIG